MPLPDGFSEWEHLREQITVAHNLQAELSFFGIDAEDISTVQGSLRQATIIKEDDTVDMIVLRLFLYHFKLRKDLPTPVFGIPVPDYQSVVTYKPQVKLFFIEPFTPLLQELKLNQATAEISFRLSQYTNQTINRAEATSIAENIKTEFGEGMGYTWMKGPTIVKYKDLPNGYNFKLFVESEAVGVSLIEKIVAINKHAYNENLLTVSTTHRVYPQDPGLQEVYGYQAKKPRRRPTTEVRFQRAEMHVWGLEHPISLVDLTRKTTPLVH